MKKRPASPTHVMQTNSVKNSHTKICQKFNLKITLEKFRAFDGHSKHSGWWRIIFKDIFAKDVQGRRISAAA